MQTGPDREAETLPGPSARLGRVTGMEIPGVLAETGIRKMVSETTHNSPAIHANIA
jgi:hypothetical protein